MGRATRRALVAIVALGIAAGAAACSSDEGSDGSEPPAPAASGAQVYATNCASCHGADGSGGQGPVIGDGVAADNLTRAQMIHVVANGRDAMPAWKGHLSEEEIAAVVAYVRTDLGVTD